MSGRYSYIESTFWLDYTDLSEREKIILLYLATGPHSNMIGCARIPAAYIAVDLSLDRRDVLAGLKALKRRSCLEWDEKTGEIAVLIPSVVQGLKGPKQVKGAEKLARQVKSTSVKAALFQRLSSVGGDGIQEIGQALGIPYPNPDDTISDGNRLKNKVSGSGSESSSEEGSEHRGKKEGGNGGEKETPALKEGSGEVLRQYGNAFGKPSRRDEEVLLLQAEAHGVDRTLQAIQAAERKKTGPPHLQAVLAALSVH